MLLALTLFAVADEGLVPLLGWGSKIRRTNTRCLPICTPSRRIFVYGFATDGVRRLVRKAI